MYVWYGMYVCEHNIIKHEFSRAQNGRSVPYIDILVVLVALRILETRESENLGV